MDISIPQLLLACAVTFGIVYKIVPVLIKVAYIKELYDKPDGERKLHRHFVSSLGGVAIFLAFMIGFTLSGYADNLQGFAYFSTALVMLFFTGLKDDLIGLSPVKKLVVELSSAALLILGCNLLIANFHGVFGIHEIPFYLSVPITVFTIIVVMNAFNLIDGIDGLAGGIGAIASIFFAAGFYLSGHTELAALSAITAISLVGYLFHNFNPASIFMGDSGSLVVGMLLAFQAIQFIGLGAVSGLTNSVTVSASTAILLPVAVLSVPLYDTLRVFIKRFLLKRSPFEPGRDHVHHELLSIGFSHKQVTLLLYLNTVVISVMAITAASYLNVNGALLAIIGSALFLMPTNGLKRFLCKKIGLFDIERYFVLKRTAEYRQMNLQAKTESDERVMREVGENA